MGDLVEILDSYLSFIIIGVLLIITIFTFIVLSPFALFGYLCNKVFNIRD
jgi:hypothetical protein